MMRLHCLALLAVLTWPAFAGANQAASDHPYEVVKRQLEAARARKTLSSERARLEASTAARQQPGLGLYVSGYAALLSYDRTTAGRLLRDSFARSASAYVALALATAASEAGRQRSCIEWATKGLTTSVDRDQLTPAVELRLVRSDCHFRLRDYRAQRADIDEALRLATEAGDQPARAFALRTLGYQLHNANESAAAVVALNEAIAIDEGRRDEAALAADLLAMSNPYATTHSFAEKIPILDRALALSRKAHDRKLQGRVHAVRGASFILLGKHGAAYRDMLTADTLLRETGLTRNRAANVGNLGLLFRELGDFERSEEQGRLALSLYRLAENPSGVMQTSTDLGDIALRRQDSAKALSHYRRAEAISRAADDRLYLRVVLLQVARAHMARGEWGPAETSIRESLMFSDESGDAGHRASARAALADLLRRTGRADEASNHYEAALQLARGTGVEPVIHIQAHHGLGLLNASEHRADEALSHFRAALDRIEQVRTATDISDLQVSYFAEKQALYADAINTLFEANSAQPSAEAVLEAFSFAERAKARTLLDAIGPRPADVQAPRSVAEIASSLEPTDLLVEFMLGTPHSFVFTLTSTGKLTLDRLASRDAIERSVSAFRALVDHRPTAAESASAETRVKRAGQQLYALVLSAALAPTPSHRRLIVVGDGLLFYTPFAALTKPGQTAYLGESIEIARAPSASVFSTVRARDSGAAPRSDFVGFGDPSVSTERRGDDAELVRALERSGFNFAALPGSRQEVMAAAEVFGPKGSRVFTGRAFTEATALQELQRPHGVVHFASHAVLDERVPQRSGIVVSQDEAGVKVLRARDLAGLRIPVDLVTLSGCQTGLGRIVDGEGVMGLAWAFSRAGAGSVMVTLWNVSDAASATMMVSFYRALREGHSKSAALLAARRGLLNGSNAALKHPFYWAGYALIGGG